MSEQPTKDAAQEAPDQSGHAIAAENVPGLSEVTELAKEHLPAFGYDWMLEVFVVLLGTAMVSFAAGWALRIVSKMMSKTASQWDDIFVESVRAPLKCSIWVVGVYLALSLLYHDAQPELLGFAAKVRDVVIVLLVAWALLRYINAGVAYYMERQTSRGRSYDYTSLNAISKLLKIAVLITAALITLQNLGISVDGVLAFGGISGIAVGFAAKDMLANFFGALIIYFDKPFKVGDWIRSPDQEIEGTVEDIGWRMTTIRTFQKRPLYVPNSVFTNISVENPSRMTHRRIYETVGIRYDDIGVMDIITRDVKAMLEQHKEIDETQTLIVNFNAFNSSSCDFFVYAFTHTTVWAEFHAVKHDVLLKIAQIIDDHGAEIAYPTQVEYSMVRDLDAAEERQARKKKSEEEAASQASEEKPSDKARQGGKAGPDMGEAD